MGTHRRPRHLIAWLALLCLVTGPAYAVQYSLDRLPAPDLWSGILFNGNKIGFSHLEVKPEPGGYILRAESAFHLRFLNVDKRFAVSGTDRINADLTLRRFTYDYSLDGNRLSVEGEVSDNTLTTTITSGDKREISSVPLKARLYPSEALLLYPVLHGLEVGRHYRFMIYDGETRQLGEVEQDVLASEPSGANGANGGVLYQVRSRTGGNEVTSWIDAQGRPVREVMMEGLFAAALEDEDHARAYLTSAALNKDDTLLSFSRVALDTPIPAPHQTSRLVIELKGLNGVMPLSDNIQRCTRTDDTVRCEVSAAGKLPATTASAPDLKTYLTPSITVPNDHSAIARLAREIVGTRPTPIDQVDALLAWIRANVRQEMVDVFSALDVLEKHTAECQGHSYLYAALARSLGIPTRVVNGLVYSPQHQGLLYHTWTESWLDGRWQAVDSTFSQARADATHIMLLEGETPAALAPMVRFMGRVKARVIAVE